MLIVSIAIAILFIFLGIAIKYLKWSWLIAGYNTAKAEYKKNIDADGLTLFMGNMLLLIAAAWIVNIPLYLLNIEIVGFFGIYGTIVLLIVIILLAQKYDNNPGKEKRKILSFVFAGVFASIMITISLFLYFSGKETKFLFINKSMVIKDIYGKTILIDTISSVHLKNSMPETTAKNNGFDMGNIKKGTFTVHGLGKILLFVHTKKGPYVYLKRKEGLIIINMKTPEKTKSIYKKIVSLMRKYEKSKE